VAQATRKAGKGGVKAWAKQFEEHFTFNLNTLPEDDIQPLAPSNPYDAVCNCWLGVCGAASARAREHGV
jgi:hypothetical protein